ncbi:ChrR family anti-sigma-E factor [Vibrio sp. JC009]|uniref:ChrR family anti-sigma-E factor n=1 Tax=Vibrio sp. JC009 TaxID=2912314 RepID=UPI0023B02B2B|nr:ChrR family anti-sigma-E factor [Vibrio sp. JC009]WED22445.1 ChrR family anti-sigma-E factor [Vibrio sp. JC009]
MSYHPSEEMLLAYADGTIDACNGVAVAAHLEVCHECKFKVESLEEELSKELACFPDMDFDDDFEAMLEGITALPKDNTQVKTEANSHIEVNGKSFVLPRSLSRLSRRITKWHSYGGKVYSAQLKVDEPARMNLLYINKGVTVPQHTHKGIESTLVLHGSFRDENGTYKAGDFIVTDGSVKHSPETPEDQDCLCLTILTEPMVFTQGVARVFNMFGRGMYP